MSETLRYSLRALRADYLRAGAGLVLSLGPAIAIPAASPAMYVLLPAAALFLAFGVRTWRRQISRVEIGPAGISLFSPSRVSLPWNRVQAVKLSYYSTRSDRTGGWMQLTLKGEDPQRGGKLCALRVDSSLDAFERVARLAATAAVANGVVLPDATRSNLSALGISVDELQPSGVAAADGRTHA
jgi:hypothetical protein